MDIWYSVNQQDFKRYTTDEIHKEFLIDTVFVADDVTAVYSHVDRMVTLGAIPVKERLNIEKKYRLLEEFWHPVSFRTAGTGNYQYRSRGKSIC